MAYDSYFIYFLVLNLFCDIILLLFIGGKCYASAHERKTHIISLPYCNCDFSLIENHTYIKHTLDFNHVYSMEFVSFSNTYKQKKRLLLLNIINVLHVTILRYKQMGLEH